MRLCGDVSPDPDSNSDAGGGEGCLGEAEDLAGVDERAPLPRAQGLSLHTDKLAAAIDAGAPPWLNGLVAGLCQLADATVSLMPGRLTRTCPRRGEELING